MLGHSVLNEFERFNGKVAATTRKPSILKEHADIEVIKFDAEFSNFESIDWDLKTGDYIINCIGLIKSRIVESNAADVKLAHLINGDLPKQISNYVQGKEIRVIQIATDCVFDGGRGSYTETSEHDARDTYGLSKSKGEIESPNFMNIRCSIVGPEIQSHTSLFDWVRFQSHGATIIGFQNHIWNGVTAKAFAQLCRGIVEKNCFFPGTQHLLPANKVTKLELIRLFAQKTGRSDLIIIPGKGIEDVDRSLSTNSPLTNEKLWKCSGHSRIPTIENLVDEL
jgi:dTDP-4-dehydrorhamnose reductase